MKSIVSLFIIILMVGCSTKKTDQELFDEAQRNLKQDKIPEAVMAFEEIVNDHSDSELAPETLSQLAGLYQNKLIKSLSEKDNLEK
jgi:outer membrane protein assembly factor BamD (BamD/ComL family)